MIQGFAQSSSRAVPTPAAEKPHRVYMDEISGHLLDFDGNHVRVLHEGTVFDFDVTTAAIECENGLLCGDEVSVIYEGKLEGLHTEKVKALKVADALHKRHVLEEYTITGTLEGMTCDTLTLKTADGVSLTCPVTGKKINFLGGAKIGGPVTLHVKGDIYSQEGEVLLGSSSKERKLPEGAAVPAQIRADRLLVLSISDTEPWTDPAAAPEYESKPTDPNSQLQRLRITVQSLDGNKLTASLDRSAASLVFDLSLFPFDFPGGITRGSNAYLYYYGSFNGENISGLTISRITGINPADQKASDMQSSVTGTVVGKTANTVTLLTQEGGTFTFFNRGLQNLTSQAFAAGSVVRVLFEPTQSGETNLYTVLRVEDA